MMNSDDIHRFDELDHNITNNLLSIQNIVLMNNYFSSNHSKVIPIIGFIERIDRPTRPPHFQINKSLIDSTNVILLFDKWFDKDKNN